MPEATKLVDILSRIHGKGYKAYKQIKGEYKFPDFILFIDHVQGDPFAAPSRIRARVDRAASGFSAELTRNKSRRIGLCDYLARQFFQSCRKHTRGRRGTGKSGLITMDQPGQEILKTTAIRVTGHYIEARFFMGLPAQGRRILGEDARVMFLDELPRVVRHALYHASLKNDEIETHILLNEDADSLRNQLDGLGLIGFVANESLLPRTSGIDSVPLDDKNAIRFQSPDSMQTNIKLPNAGIVTGMGIPKGVTLIVGGGYHGKSTLLRALELGIYNHIPGDGREFVVTLPDTIKIRAADGRSIVKTDISPFIDNLPFEKDTTLFSTKNASGSTSQAANIAEALETGARLLLLDEDTSATNFMIRDHRMQQLVAKEQEPITPFIDRVRQLYDQTSVSTILVMGGSGDYFSEAHQVIQMTAYVPLDVTTRAHQVAQAHPTGRRKEGGQDLVEGTPRRPVAQSFNPYRGKRTKIAATRLDEILFGKTVIDLRDVEQLVHISQTRGIALAIHYAMQYMDGKQTLKEVLEQVMADVNKKGLDVLTPYLTGDIAQFRSMELAAAINRMRTLQMA